MIERLNMAKTEPSAMKAMQALEIYLKRSGISSRHKELIGIRASQINACAFCLELHTRQGKESGITDQELHLMDAWRDAGIFSQEDQVVLAIAEEITLIREQRLTDYTYRQASHLFSESYIAKLIMAAVIINAWNRISIATRIPLSAIPEPALVN